jgi:hypothetical protein
MAGEYYIELRNFTTGARIAVVTGATGSGSSARNGFLKLNCRKVVNAPGQLVFDVPADFPGLWSLADKTQAILFRRDIARGIDWYKEFVGLLRDPSYQSRNGEKRVALSCPGLLSILGWYHVLWPANVANRTTFTSAKAETIMKTLVDRNAVAANATAAAGRDRNAPDYGVSIQADAAGGNTLDWTANRSHTLLEELQALALVAGGDFDLIYNTSTSRQFKFYAGQLGSDKHTTITFSEAYGNMDNVRFKRVRSSERTVALVAATGQESNRNITTRTGPNYSATNDIEVFVDARDLGANDTAAARQARGDKRLDDLQARDEFAFDVVQTQGTYYGPSGTGSYTLGDLVAAVRPDGVSVTQQVYAVNLGWAPGELEDIAIEVRTQ